MQSSRHIYSTPSECESPGLGVRQHTPLQSANHNFRWLPPYPLDPTGDKSLASAILLFVYVGCLEYGFPCT